jgi:hypothetical protein
MGQIWGRAERESFSFQLLLKTYANLWEGKSLAIPNHQ